MLKHIAVLSILLSSWAWSAPAGEIPTGMPHKLSVGLFEDTGKTWMKTSGVRWDVRYRYLTHKWSSNWGYGPTDGSFAGQFFRETDAQGFIPAIAYYEIFDIGPSGVGQYEKTQDPAVMREYFNDFKLLLQQAKTFDKPVLIMIEPDGYAFLQQSARTPNAPAAVASTGIPELGGLPNTAAGWGLAFLQLKKMVGADKVVLGIHISGWATGEDLFHYAVTVPLQARVDNVYAFLGPLGLQPNVTGLTYDVLVGDPLDRDADYYRIARNEDRVWDPLNTASINSKSFNRYAEWMRLWNQKSGKRWVLWQLPIGNSFHTNVCNQGGPRQGYKDNRVAYFFTGSGAEGHRNKFMDAGAIALLFGQGEGCQASYQNDLNSAGQPYLKTQATAFLNGAVVSVDAGSIDAGVVDAGTMDAGQPIVDAGVADAGQPIAADPTQYNFEASAQGFVRVGATITSVTQQPFPFAGAKSLGVQFSGTPPAAQQQVALQAVIDVPKGAVITYNIFLPVGMPLSSLQVFVQENSTKSWRWTSQWQPVVNLKLGQWNSLKLATPTDLGPLQSIGVEFALSAPYAGMAFIDSINWNGTNTPTPDAGTDAGAVDAGLPVRDASVPDASIPVDASVPVAIVPVDAGSATGIRLSPTGDSVTAEEWAWRCQLSKLLPDVQFVGSVTNQYDTACAPKHEGHPGFTTDGISSAMAGWFATTRPNLVVLMIGTNDIAWWTTETGTAVANRIDGMVTKIQGLIPGVRIVVCTIPPQSSSIIAPNNVDRAQLAIQLNAQLKLRTNVRIAGGQRVALADVNAALTIGDLRDGIHPTTQAGIQKIAPVIKEAVDRVRVIP